MSSDAQYLSTKKHKHLLFLSIKSKQSAKCNLCWASYHQPPFKPQFIEGRLLLFLSLTIVLWAQLRIVPTAKIKPQQFVVVVVAQSVALWTADPKFTSSNSTRANAWLWIRR